MDKFHVNGRSQEKSKKKQRVHSLTGRIDDRVMQAAFKTVKRNRGAAEIDKVSNCDVRGKPRRQSGLTQTRLENAREICSQATPKSVDSQRRLRQELHEVQTEGVT